MDLPQVTILDVNDNRPQWAVDAGGQQVRYDANLAENLAVGSVVATVVATDADQPGTPNSAVRYSFASGGDGNGHFTINPVSGAINLTNALDYETATEHRVTVLVTDMGDPPLASLSPLIITFSVTDVNDNAPIFDEPLNVSVSIAEDEQPNIRIVTTVRATDADSGINSEVRYSLLETQVPFSLDAVTGILRLASPGLDYDHPATENQTQRTFL